jgi:hypothetical protein
MGFKITSKGKQSVKDGINAKARERKGALAAETSLKAKVSVIARNDLSPQLHLEYRSPDQLHPAKRRLRRSNPTHVETVCRSISAMGFCLPVLIAGEGAIIDGHIRWEAACRLVLESIPCIVIDQAGRPAPTAALRHFSSSNRDSLRLKADIRLRPGLKLSCQFQLMSPQRGRFGLPVQS